MLLLGDLLRRNVSVRPDKVAVIYEGTSLTFREMNDLVNQFANALVDLGVRRGDRIGLLHTNSHLFEVAYFASIKIGAILVPICFWYKEPEIEYVANKSGISTLIIGQDFLDMIQGMPDALKSVKHYIVIGEDIPDNMLSFTQLISDCKNDEPEVAVDENDPHLILFTSGTTGVPKGAVISQRNYFLHTGIFIQEMGTNENSVSMCVYPMFHMGGIMWPCANIYCGMTLVIISTPPTPKKILEAIQQHKVTHFAAVPTLWRRLLEYPDFDNYDLSSLKVAMGASDAMPKDLLEEVLKRTPASSPQLYGLSEGGCLTYLTPEDSVRKIGSSGKPHCQAEIRLMGEDGQDVAPGEVGEIICRGEHQMSFYWDMPEETSKAIRDGWLYTGDLGRFDEDGYIYIVGRKKDMIISGGQNIYPAEIERVLLKHPKIADATVVGVPDKEWGEAVLAAVVPKENLTMTDQEVIEYIKLNLASYNKPRYVQFMEALPRTAATGKVQKAELRNHFTKELNLP
jgi:acyl-CoA synthetase (AMP-forming)/AMP-acid ligase II